MFFQIQAALQPDTLDLEPADSCSAGQTAVEDAWKEEVTDLKLSLLFTDQNNFMEKLLKSFQHLG